MQHERIVNNEAALNIGQQQFFRKELCYYFLGQFFPCRLGSATLYVIASVAYPRNKRKADRQTDRPASSDRDAQIPSDIKTLLST